MEDYHGTLGLKAGASKAEIKSAYRKLAKQYHPDVSSESNAEEKFIDITEAYEWLTEGPKIFGSVNKYAEEELFRDEVEIRRERAREYARMRFETFKQNNDAFKRSWYYEPVKYGTYFIICFGYIFALAMFLAPVLAWFITKDGLAVFFMFFVFLFSSHAYKYARELHNGIKPYFANYN